MITGGTVSNALKMRTPILRDCFTPKYATAQIFDESGGWNCVPLPIKYQHNDHFFVKINNSYFLFKIDIAAIQTYRAKAARPIQTFLYSTKDYHPFIPGDEATLQRFLDQHGIEKLGIIHALFIHVASMKDDEGNPRTMVPFDEVISEIVEKINPEAPDAADQIREIEALRYDFHSEGLVKPIRPVAKVLDRKMHNSGEYMFMGYNNLKNLNWEWKKIANPAKTPFAHWGLLLGIFGVLGVIGIVGYVMSDPTLFASGPDNFEQLLKASQEHDTPEDFLGGGAAETERALTEATEAAGADGPAAGVQDFSKITERALDFSGIGNILGDEITEDLTRPPEQPEAPAPAPAAPAEPPPPRNLTAEEIEPPLVIPEGIELRERVNNGDGTYTVWDSEGNRIRVPAGVIEGTWADDG